MRRQLFVGQLIFIGQKGKVLPDYLGKLTKITQKEVHFKPYRLIDEYYLNDGYVLKWENHLFPYELTAPKSYVMDKVVLDRPKDFQFITEKL